jgi:hypothetical protein
MRPHIAATLLILAVAALAVFGLARTSWLDDGGRPRPAGTVTTTPAAPVRP